MVMMHTYLELLNEAKEILQRNTMTVTINGKRYERIIPSRDFYVHQWLWDSAGIAMGQVHIDEEAAFNELLSLIAGQWNNGLIPHIIYNPGELRYYPPADQWQTTRFTRDGIKTSGITDPPLLAIAAEYVCNHASDEKKKRDFINTINRIDLNKIPTAIKANVDLNRKDIRYQNSEERPSGADYYRYIYLIELFKDLAWDYTTILHKTPFAVKDILFNSIWARANEALAALLHTYRNQEEANKYQQWAEQTQKALTNTWSEEYNQYCDIDVTQGRHQAIAAPTNAIFMPLCAGAVTDAQLDILLQRLSNTDEFCTEYPVPSTAIHSRYFDKERYWRGPTWPITNFFIIEGLKRYEATYKNVDQLATFFMQKTVQMIRDNGFWEYFDPLDDGTDNHAKGMGFSSFSWTAAIVILLLNKLYHN